MSNDYDPAVRSLIDAIEGLPQSDVYNVTPTVGRTTIDFALGSDPEVPLMKRATGGRFGSSVVIDTTNDEVLTATLRYGSLGLPEGGDLLVASNEVRKRIERADPPAPADIGDEDAPIYVRFRDMASYTGVGLVSEGLDVLHVVVNERVPVDDFIPWFERFTRLYRQDEDDIREFTLEVGLGD